MIKPSRQSKLRNQKIGSILLEGPEWINPSSKVNNFGWLEPVYSLINQPMGIRRNAFSYSVFVDNTINRHKKFLLPLVRYAEWNREIEYKSNRVRKWPIIKIIHHVLNKKESKRINELLFLIDESFSKINFLKAGLITDRSEPDNCWPDDERKITFNSLQVQRWNYCQRIEFGIGENTELNPVILKINQSLANYIKKLCVKDTTKNYRECYSSNLKEIKYKTDYWYYRPKVTG